MEGSVVRSRQIVLGMLLVGAALPGCLDLQLQGVTYYYGASVGNCPQEATECTWTEEPDGWHLRLRGIQLAGGDGETVGINAGWTGDKDLWLHLSDFDVSGFQRAFQASTCTGCHFLLSDGSIAGDSADDSAAVTVHGEADVDVTLRNVTVRGFDVCTIFSDADTVTLAASRWSECGTGFSVVDSAQVTVERLHIEDVAYVGNLASLDTPGNIVVQDSLFQGGSGPWVYGANATFRNVTLVGQEQGGMTFTGGSLVMDSTTFRDGQYRARLLQSSGYALNAKASFLELRGLAVLNVTGNGVLLSGNWANSTALVEDSRFSGVTGTSVAVSGALGSLSARIRGTTFEDSRGTAVANHGPAPYWAEVDASDNYWGSPLGPDPTCQGLAGMCVDPTVQFVPWRTSP